jgi:REase_DpnII-MboI
MRYTRFMELETIYNIVVRAAQGADRLCTQETASGMYNTKYAGYLHYVDEYNRLLGLAALEQPDVTNFCPAIVLPPEPRRGTSGVKSDAELAALRLNGLVAYLQSKLGKTQQEYERIIDLIRANLRPAIYDDPKHEREVQNALETIFRARALDFRREQETVPYSTKRYIPDFTFDRIGLAVEVKLCKDKDREKDMIGEINDDIIGYCGKYDRCVFVVYDLGFIRDVARFSEDIEKNPNVHVLIVKK